MPTTIYDSSLITKRKQNRTIANSFLTRIQNPTNPSSGSAPLLGITEQSIINEVHTGQMTSYRRSDGCTFISRGCPCGDVTLESATADPVTNCPPSDPLPDFLAPTDLFPVPGFQTLNTFSFTTPNGVTDLYIYMGGNNEDNYEAFAIYSISNPTNNSTNIFNNPYTTTFDAGNGYTMVNFPTNIYPPPFVTEIFGTGYDTYANYANPVLSTTSPTTTNYNVKVEGLPANTTFYLRAYTVNDEFTVDREVALAFFCGNDFISEGTLTQLP